jgi:hypothetical protein
MKKLLIVLLILMTASVGLFAQLTPYGSLRLDFGGSTTLTDGDTAGVWKLDALTSGTGFGLKGKVGDVTGDIHFALNGDIDVGGIWAPDPVELKAGYTWLPATNWSSLAIWGNSNWAIGATATGRATFIQIGAFGGYLGIAGQTGTGGGWNGGSSLDIDPQNTLGLNLQPFRIGGANPFLTDQSIPVIFAGYDYSADAVSFGISATVWKDKDANGDDAIPMLFTLRGKYDAGAFAVGLNAGFHIAPGALPIHAVLSGPAANDVGGTKDDMMVEALLDFTAKLDPATIAVTAGYVHNFAEKAKNGEGNALQAGLSATIGLGSGFDLIPGVVYTNYLSDKGGVDTKKSSFDYGVSLAYSF